MKSKNNNYTLIYFISSIFMYGVGFSSIFKLCKNDSWIVILIGFIITLIFLKTYKKIINKNNNIIKIINICFILLISMMILRILTTSFYLTKTPGLIITIPFMMLAIYSSNKDINVINKISNILFIFSILTITLNLFASTKTGSIDMLIPILKTNKLKLLKGIFYYICYILSPLILVSKVDIENKTYNKIYIFSNIFLIFISLIITFVLGPNLMSIYRFPEYMIFKEINLFGFVENVENLVGLIYYINLFITSSLCLYNIKSITKNKYSLYIISFVILFITEFVSINYKYSLIIYEHLPYILFSFILINIFIYIIKKE